MQTRIHPTLASREDVVEADRILRSCVHCGFCTAVCPTYQVLGDELDGPRGRIYLIKDIVEQGDVNPLVTAHIDRCLTCRACETACPSGVEYGHLLDIGRGLIAEKTTSTPRNAFLATVLRLLVPRPRVFGGLLRFARPFRALMPAFLKDRIPAIEPIRHRASDVVSQRSVIVLQGCVQRAATPNVNASLKYLLAQQGIATEFIEEEACCGALDYHLAAQAVGLDRMRKLIDLLHPRLDEVEAIISTASGCGVTIKEYDYLLRDDPDYAEKARAVVQKVRDASEYLSGFQFDCDAKRIAVHTPCTLQHGQRLGHLEQLLESAGFELVPTAESHLCCGSAGTYSIMQPDLSNVLKQRKIAALSGAQPEVIVTANIGCQLQLQSADVPVMHWLELVADHARFGE